MLWARSATSLALGAERRGRIERSMHQTWRFKRVNGTAYPDSIASSLRDASGAEVARLAESSNDLESIFRSRDGKAPSEKETEGSASEAADVETRRFGLSTAPSAAAESAFPEGSLPARADGWLRSEESRPRSASRTIAAGRLSSPRLVSGAFYRSHKWNN